MVMMAVMTVTVMAMVMVMMMVVMVVIIVAALIVCITLRVLGHVIALVIRLIVVGFKLIDLEGIYGPVGFLKRSRMIHDIFHAACVQSSASLIKQKRFASPYS